MIRAAPPALALLRPGGAEVRGPVLPASRRTARRPWLPGLVSAALHGAALAGILFLLPEAIDKPEREHGVEMVWQDEGVDSAASEPAAPASVDAPPAPEPMPPTPQAAAPPPAVPPPPAPPQQVARAVPPPPQAAAVAPPAPPRSDPMAPPAPPRSDTMAPPAPPRSDPVAAPAPPEGPTEAPLPPEARAPAPAEAPPGAPVAAEPPPQQAAPAEPSTTQAVPAEPAAAEAAPAEPLPEVPQMAEILPLPPPPMPLPLAPLRTAEARQPPRPAAAPMRPTPGITPLGQPGEGERQAEQVGATRVVGAVVPPGLLDGVRNAQPEYPQSSRLRGEQGVVALVLQISPGGQVTGVEVGRSSGYPQLDEAARKAAQRWRFRPATRDGVPIEGTIRTQVHFRLVQ